MKKLVEFIDELFVKYEHDLLSSSTLLSMEIKINNFICFNYRNIKFKKYVRVEERKKDFGVFVNIDPEFEEELRKHYPEKLI